MPSISSRIMPAGREKSRSKRRIQRRLPGGRTKTYFKEALPSFAKCGRCGRPLSGVPRYNKHRKLAKTEKRPERPYGGNLCSKCFREEMKKQALQKAVALQTN